MSQTQKLIAFIVVGLVIGTGVGWVAYPSINPPPTLADYVKKSDFDALQTQLTTVQGTFTKAQTDYTAALTKAQTDYTTLQGQLTKAQTDLSTAQAQITKLTSPKKIGLVLATGGLGDKSFNDISYAGLIKAKNELGIVFDYVQPKAIAEYEGYQRDFAKSGDYALIICIGFDQADALTKVATDYPNQNFAIVDMVVDKPNVASLVFRSNESSFLVGVVAAMSSSTGQVGFVGGMDIPLIRDFFVGYQAGAKWANPQITVLDPVFVGDWADPTKGKELAISLIENGGDAIYAAAGKSGLGALEAVHEKGVKGFGVDACQDYLYPQMVASATKRVDVAVYEMIQKAIIGKFKGGVYSGGIKEGWTGCCRLPEEESFWESTFNFTHTPLDSSVMDKLLMAKDKIIMGDITVPSGY
jgi:basic membrane protein A